MQPKLPGYLCTSHLFLAHCGSWDSSRCLWIHGPVPRCSSQIKPLLFCQNLNPNSTQPQPNKTLGWVRRENDFAHPTTQTQCQQYLSCYWPDFDETLKVGSWKHLEPISTIKLTFVPATFVLATFVHTKNNSAITDPILTKLFYPIFWWSLIFLTNFLFLFDPISF